MLAKFLMCKLERGSEFYIANVLCVLCQIIYISYMLDVSVCNMPLSRSCVVSCRHMSCVRVG